MSIVSGTLGAVMSADAASDATKAQKQTTANALALQERMYNDSRNANWDYEQSGITALPYLMSLATGQEYKTLDPTYKALSPAELSAINVLPDGSKKGTPLPYDKNLKWYKGPDGTITNTPPTIAAKYDPLTNPSYTARRNKGMETIAKYNAANGLSGSSFGRDAMAEYDTNLAGDEYDRSMNRLLDIVKIGTGASYATGQNNAQNASSQAGILANLGNALGQGAMNRASMWSGMGGASANTASAVANIARAFQNQNSAGGGTTYDAGGANFSGNTAGSGAVDNYGASIYE